MTKPLAASKCWKDSLDPQLESEAIWADSIENIRAFSHLPRLREMDALFQAAKDKIILGEASAREAMADATAQVNEILAEVNEEVEKAGL